MPSAIEGLSPRLRDLVRLIDKQQPRAFLRAHQDHVAIHKLRANRGLTPADVAELERILAESGVGAADQLNRARTESEGLGLFVRS